MATDRSINPWNTSLPSPDLVPQYKGDWAAVPYQKANVVSKDGNMYIALTNTTSLQTPGASPTKWKLILPGNTNAEAINNLRVEMLAERNPYRAAVQGSAQAAADAAFTAGHSQIFGEGMHNLTQPLILSGSEPSLVGNSTAKWIYSTNTPVTETVVKSNVDLPYLVKVPMSKLALGGTRTDTGAPWTADVGSFAVDRMSFVGSHTVAGSGAANGIFTDGVLGPGRPFKVHNSTFKWFDSALRFDQHTSGDVPIVQGNGTPATAIFQTSWYNMQISGNTFTGNNNAIWAEGYSTLGGLEFNNNVSEQGGRIFAGRRATFGYIGITRNLLEGQSNAVTMGSGLGSHFDLRWNYFEVNSGPLFNILGDEFGRSTLYLKGNYIDGAAPDSQRTSVFRNIYKCDLDQPDMIIKGRSLRVTSGARNVMAWLPDFETPQTDVFGTGEPWGWILSPPHEQIGATDGTVYFVRGYSPNITKPRKQTPLGRHPVWYANEREIVNVPLAVGQVALVSVMARSTNGAVQLVGARITNGAETVAILHSGMQIPLRPEWQLLTFYSKVSTDVSSVGINLIGSSIEWTSAYINVLPNEQSKYEIYYPYAEELGTVADSNGTLQDNTRAINEALNVLRKNGLLSG